MTTRFRVPAPSSASTLSRSADSSCSGSARSSGSAARSGSVRTWLLPTHATRSSASRCASSSVRATTTIGRERRKARAPDGEMRRPRGPGHTKDARLRQMGPKGVNERSDAAITTARRGHAPRMVPARAGRDVSLRRPRGR